jgi:hypothetical protein
MAARGTQLLENEIDLARLLESALRDVVFIRTDRMRAELALQTLREEELIHSQKAIDRAADDLARLRTQEQQATHQADEITQRLRLLRIDH